MYFLFFKVTGDLDCTKTKKKQLEIFNLYQNMTVAITKSYTLIIAAHMIRFREQRNGKKKKFI